jgi:YD repeat-containing protein
MRKRRSVQYPDEKSKGLSMKMFIYTNCSRANHINHFHWSAVGRLLVAVFLCHAMFRLPTTIEAGTVDIKNANYSDTWVDIGAGQGDSTLRVERGYNSRTLYDGMFGFGWCSDFESILEPLSDGRLKYVECGAGRELSFTSMGNNADQSEMHYRLVGGNGEINYKKGHYFVTFGGVTNESFHEFDEHLRLLRQRTSDGPIWEFHYDGNLLKSVSDGHGKRLFFDYFSNRKVKSVRRSDGETAEYAYTLANDLIRVRTASGHIFTYSYDQLHDLTRIDFPNGTYKEMTYDTERDWIVRFRDVDGCVEKYDYVQAAKNPNDHFWALVAKQCNGVSESMRYEFWYTPRSDIKQEKFLSRSLTLRGADSLEINYGEDGFPTAEVRNGIKREIVVNGYGHQRVSGRITNMTSPEIEVKVIQLTDPLDFLSDSN